VRRAAAAVAHRVHLVGRQQAEGGQWDGDAEDDAGQDVGRVVLREVEPGHGGEDEQPADDPLADGAEPAGRHQGVQRADQEGAEQRHRDRGHGEAGPGTEHLDLEGPGALQRAGHAGAELDDDEAGSGPDEQVPPPPQDDEREQVGQPQDVQRPAGGQEPTDLREPGQPRGADLGDRLEHPGVGHVDGRDVPGGDDDEPRGDDQPAERQPPLAGGVEVPRQGRWFPGGAAAPADAVDRRGSRSRHRDDRYRVGRRLRQRPHAC
jgi:hypothetical protein